MDPEVSLNVRKQLKRRKHFLLNTKGCCFLCLELLVFKTEEAETSKNENEKGTSISLKSLNRCLKINSGDYVALKTGGCADILQQEHVAEKEIKVDLCESCARILTKFTKTFGSLEMIQTEVNYWLERIHQQISEGSKRPEVVQTYSRRMTSDMETLKQLANVDKLRREIANKSSETNYDCEPRVHLVRLKDPNKYFHSGSAQELEQQPAPSPPPSGDDFEDPKGRDEDFDFSLPLLETEVIIKPEGTASTEPHPHSLSQDSTSGTSSAPSAKRRGKYCNLNSTTRKYDCVKCKESFRYHASAADHYLSIHLKKVFKCDKCDIILKHRTNLTRHTKICSGFSDTARKNKGLTRKFTCRTCGKGFTSSYDLRRHHKIVHLKLRNFSCDMCTKTFTHSGNLKAHKAAIHFGKKFYCKTCNKPFKYRDGHKAHESVCRSSNASINQLLKEDAI